MPAASSVAANWRLENPGRREIGRSRTSISAATPAADSRSEEHTSELQSLAYLVCRLLLEKKKTAKLQSVRQGGSRASIHSKTCYGRYPAGGSRRRSTRGCGRRRSMRADLARTYIDDVDAC